MSYKTLYRTYRPQNFSDVVGQEHITRTFRNALKKDKISHAYLFTGPRGTGKTSVAKIIAKAVNCEKAPTDEPCNKCDSCLSINSGFDSDIFEIDAASNNGVDEIREIRDKVKYAPTIGRFKVYIIDEVHMLSTGAFNALLKTLEEPPSHVIFILATTEPHKIPATIISRCQRFDFKSISIKDIIFRMKYVVTVENIKIEEKAIYTIAKNAQGGMRDALSLLDQAISYSEDNVTEADVHEITGTVSEGHLVQVVEELISFNTKEVINILDNLISLGKEPLRLIENMIFYFRDLFLIRKMKEIDEHLVVNHSEQTKQIAKKISDNQLMSIIKTLNNAQYEMRKTNHPRVFIELAVFEMVNLLDKKENLVKETVNQKVVEKKESPKEVSPKEENQVIKKTVENETEKRYIDVTIIENVLNNASKEKKNNLVYQWKSIYGTKVNMANIRQLLVDGQVEAVSLDNKIILSYDFDTECAKLYEKEFYEKAIELLENEFKDKYQIIPLPKRIWNAKRDEFAKQYRNNIKRPKLSPIDEPIIVKKNTNKYEFEPDFVKEAVNIFGDDIVNIK
ncbi:DNA polymerase III subunit gamma/tau [Mycoplasmatota bacterium]|nr:DNA polymerase III subunit gamma/tau [Mycoplasmatota bacterium]